MGIVLIGLGMALIAFVDYCCCRAASLAERQMEAMPPKEQSNGEM